MSAYFITATGTDIGKSFATCALLHAAPQFKGYKPIISGFEGDDTDTHRIIEAMGGGAIDDVSPWRFTMPLAPSMAGIVHYDELVVWSRRKAQEHALIEGVGGVLVPLDAQHTVRDWMVALNIPAILVAGSYLGSINHTLLSLEVLKAAQIPVRALIVSESENSTVPLEATCKTLAQHTDALIVAQPRVSSYKQAHAIHALAKVLA